MDNEQQIKIIEEIFSQKGMDLTEDQFNSLKSKFKKLAEKLKSMSLEELEEVSGGSNIQGRAGLGATMGGRTRCNIKRWCRSSIRRSI